jgi:hypothetical protein
MEQFQLTGKNWAKISTLEMAGAHAIRFPLCGVKRPNLKLKTWPKQLLGSLLLDTVLPCEGLGQAPALLSLISLGVCGWQ